MTDETQPDLRTVEGFTAHTGYSPQEFFGAEVRSAAAGARIGGYLDDAVKAEIALAKVPDPQIIPDDGRKIGGYTHLEAIMERGRLESLINDRRRIMVPADVDVQKHAQDFLDGTIDDYAPFLTPQGRSLNDAGLIDTKRRPE